MKQWLFTLTLALSTNSLAKSMAIPDIICTENASGFMYSFYLAKEEILVFDENGKELSSYKKVAFSIKPVETLPEKTEYSFYQGENSIAEVVFTEGKDIGRGQFYDSDQTMTCSNTRAWQQLLDL